MTELGNRLKEARLNKGLSFDDVQTMTKIQKRYLIGIEEGDYSSMPGNFYVRAFIKQYAEALGLNPDEIFETYKNEIPAAHHDELPQNLSRVNTHKTISQGNSKIFDILPKVIIVVFVIGIASIVYYFVSSHAGSDSNEQVSKDHEPVNYVKSESLEKAKSTDKDKSKNNNDKGQKKEEEKAPEVKTAEQQVSVVQSSGRNTTYSLNNADKFVIKLVSRGQSWVSVKNGKGKSFYQGTLRAGQVDNQTVDLSGESEAVMIIGNSTVTDIYVNDQKLEYSIPANQQVRQDITIQFVPKSQ
ncbi:MULTISPECIES: helix-turn-helix domain-containing protein [Bacillaceae]|uniref:helix-turn-helix domain-containing protein n=1 Tax=Bacillaceae TaxID=186817 RepID=UPI002FFE4C42